MGSVQTTCANADERCPVDHDNMTTDEINNMMERYKKMGRAAFKTNVNSSATNTRLETSSDTNHSPVSASEPSRCPVDHRNMREEQKAACLESLKNPRSNKQDTSNKPTVYDVYGQEIDRANLMPTTPNQLPSPGQKQPLCTDRVKSSIPKSEQADTWTYPSPQMFYNALKRKGKADDVDESDMAIVVNLHNAMNERTWEEVMRWERNYHCRDCTNPKLKRFMGRPKDLSPAARFRTWFRGYPRPFDRHDWIVDRCGEQDARYIIDYYYREGPDPVEIHVRPALDSFSAVFDRVRSGFRSFKEETLGTNTGGADAGSTGWQSEFTEQGKPHVLSGHRLDQSEFDFLSNLTTSDIKDIGEDVKAKCAKVNKAFREVGDDPVKMEKANISLNYCMAQSICKTQAADFMSALEDGSDGTEEYERMTSCLERFHIMARRAILEEAGVIQSGPEFPPGTLPSVSSSRNPTPASVE